MRILFIHAHYDDYEFAAAGTFELWRRKLGKDLRARVLICTDGKAGHHFRTREETGRMRVAEQEASARIGGYEFETLRLPDGSVPREACLGVTIPLLAALWKSIREFEPDYLFCPPVAMDPRAGIHVDHVAVGEAVRKVAYMINVPHAFTPEYPADETSSKQVRVPVILNAFDGYMKRLQKPDLAIDIDEVFPLVAEMGYCHKSQIAEWLPWVASPGIMAVPKDLADWTRIKREQLLNRNQSLGVRSQHPMEYFTVTHWGTKPTYEQILRDIPGIDQGESNLEQLREALR
jgi:LmbE family N-acetylglucosaminyl deacetylase